MQDIDTQRDGKSMVIKTTTRLEGDFLAASLSLLEVQFSERPLVHAYVARQTIFLPVIGLVEASELKPTLGSTFLSLFLVVDLAFYTSLARDMIFARQE